MRRKGVLMAESWRSILERAADNLSIELDQMAVPGFGHAPAASFTPRRLSPQLSFAESRELLARELQAFSQERRPRPPVSRQETATALTVPVTMPKQKQELARKPRKRATWQNLLATLLSAALTGGIAAYFFLAQADFGQENGSAFGAYAGQSDGLPESGGSEPAVLIAPGLVNPATEDALMQRAFQQLNDGDGKGARAIYEVLANHGSHKSAFALAATYDSATLAQNGNWGLNPDMRLARMWYKRASELGSLAAYDRLKDWDKRASLGKTASHL